MVCAATLKVALHVAVWTASQEMDSPAVQLQVCRRRANYWRPYLTGNTVFCCRSKSGFPTASLPNVDRSKWNLSGICSCMEYIWWFILIYIDARPAPGQTTTSLFRDVHEAYVSSGMGPGPFLTCKLEGEGHSPLVILHSPPSDPLWPTSKLVGGGGISRSIMFELYSHIIDYKLLFSNGACAVAPSLAKWNKQ